jgi:hypothetical protein
VLFYEGKPGLMQDRAGSNAETRNARTGIRRCERVALIMRGDHD